MHDDLLAQKPEGARHDSDICPFCVDQATEATTSRIPPGSAGPDVTESKTTPSTEGGTTKTMSDDMISKETHAALLEKAVKDATSVTESALATRVEEAKGLTTKVETLESENASLKADNEDLNKKLDSAQVELKTATDKVAALESDIKAKDEAAAKAEVQSKRTEQAKNLGCFDDAYITEKAASWADLTDEAWAERVEEWAKLKPAVSDDNKVTGDTASAMTGSTGDLTKDTDTASAPSASPRRAALGLAPKAS